MALDDTVEELKKEALLMGKSYYKGFGVSLSQPYAVAENIVNKLYDEGKKSEMIKNSESLLGDIETFYSEINFDELQGKENFYPLFIVNKLLPIYHLLMERVFETGEKNDLIKFSAYVNTVIGVGRLYDDNLKQLIKKIKEFPAENGFRLNISDRLKEGRWY